MSSVNKSGTTADHDPKTTASDSAEQLRAEIDANRAGDGTGAPDPAASPLGTDDEAAGQTDGPDGSAKARAEETRKS